MREDVLGMTCDALRQGALVKRLDGRDGTNRCRARRNQLSPYVDDDISAVRAWILECGARSEKTRRVFLSETRRLYYWLFEYSQKPLSDLNRRDLECYRDFLRTPPTCAIGRKAPYVDFDTGLLNPFWRPFEKPMTEAHVVHVFGVLGSLFKCLTAKNYLDSNPLIGLPRMTRPSVVETDTNSGGANARLLNEDQWDAVLTAVDSLVGTAQHERMRFVLRLFYHLGGRITEVSEQRMGNFEQVRDQWRWNVTGRFDKVYRLAIDDQLVDAIQRYRLHLNTINPQLKLSPLPSPGESHPVVFDLRGKKALSTRQLFRVIKAGFRTAYEQYRCIDQDEAASLTHASPLWIRKSRASHLAKAAERLEELLEIQAHMRDRTLDATVKYTNANDRVSARKRIDEFGATNLLKNT